MYVGVRCRSPVGGFSQLKHSSGFQAIARLVKAVKRQVCGPVADTMARTEHGATHELKPSL